MKKIIAAFDGLKYAESTTTYALQLAKQTNAYLVGVFLDDTSYKSYNPVNLIYEHAGLVGSAKRKWDKKDAKARATSTRNFELACKTAGLEYGIHHDHHGALKELLQESIYADLIVIGRDETLKRSASHSPTPFVKHLLSHAKCPVLVVPPTYQTAQKVVMLYDTEPASVNAIKLFSYILPGLPIAGLEVLFVKDGQHPAEPDFGFMKEWIRDHFPYKVDYIILRGDPRNQIVTYLKGRHDDSIVLLGDNHHGKIYSLLHESITDTLLKELNHPLFIAPTH